MNDFVGVGKKTAFSETVGTGVDVNGHRVCIVRQGEKVFAFDDRCTHAESLLSGGDVEDGEIVCPLHGARFAVDSGEARTLPAVKPVQTHQVKIQDDEVFVKLNDPAAR